MYNQPLFNTQLYNTQSFEIGTQDQDNIVFDGYGLQNNNIVISKFIIDNPPSRQLDIQDIPRGNGQVLLNDYWRKKRITMDGFLRTTTASQMAALVDEIKYRTSGRERDLEYLIDGTVRNHVATRINDDMFSAREHYHVTLVPIKMVFDCLFPFGTSKNYASIAWLDQTTLLLEEEVENDGTAPGSPIITLNFSAASSVTAISWENITTDEAITITEGISAGDYVRIDGEKREVRINDVLVDYSGSFPRLDVGVNSFTLEITGTSATYTHTVKHLTPFF